MVDFAHHEWKLYTLAAVQSVFVESDETSALSEEYGMT
jgi:hypothetical protein